MNNVIGTYASVCMSKLNRLKNVLLSHNQAFIADLQLDVESVTFLEQTSHKLQTLQRALVDKKESVMNRSPTKKTEILRNFSGSAADLPKVSTNPSTELRTKLDSTLVASGGDTARARRRFQNLSMVERMFTNKTPSNIEVTDLQEKPPKETTSSKSRLAIKSGLQLKQNPEIKKMYDTSKNSSGSRLQNLKGTNPTSDQIKSIASFMSNKAGGALTDRVHHQSFDLFGPKADQGISPVNPKKKNVLPTQTQNTSLKLASEFPTPNSFALPPKTRLDQFKKNPLISGFETSGKLKLDMSQLAEVAHIEGEQDTCKMSRTRPRAPFSSNSVRVNDYSIKVPQRPVSKFDTSERSGGVDGGISEDDLNMPKVQLSIRHGFSGGQLKSSVYLPSLVGKRISQGSVELLNDSSDIQTENLNSSRRFVQL